TCSPGSVNEVTILVTSDVGHTAPGSICLSLSAAHTVAGVGVAPRPSNAVRPVPIVALAGFAGLSRVVVGAVGQGRRSPPRAPLGRLRGWVGGRGEADFAAPVRRRRVRPSGQSEPPALSAPAGSLVPSW